MIDIYKELEKSYGKRCLLTGYNNNLTKYYIEKDCLDKKDDIENLALINGDMCEWIDNLEIEDSMLYGLVNECLVLYKKLLDSNSSREKLKALEFYYNEVEPLYVDIYQEIVSKKVK